MDHEFLGYATKPVAKPNSTIPQLTSTAGCPQRHSAQASTQYDRCEYRPRWIASQNWGYCAYAKDCHGDAVEKLRQSPPAFSIKSHVRLLADAARIGPLAPTGIRWAPWKMFETL
jgi:hypothetical protein